MNSQTNTLLISAFPATGKTYFADHSKLKVLDSDSSEFNKADFPRNYIDHIKENIGKVDVILINSHDVVRDALVENKLQFILIYPDKKLKERYCWRCFNRGDTDAFCKLIRTNWDEWIKQLEQQKECVHLVLQNNQYLSDAIKLSGE